MKKDNIFIIYLDKYIYIKKQKKFYGKYLMIWLISTKIGDTMYILKKNFNNIIL